MIASRKIGYQGIILFIFILIIIVLQQIVIADDQTDDANCGCDEIDIRYPLMEVNNSKIVTIPSSYQTNGEDTTTPLPKGYKNLLGYLDYNPSLRNQGICGNCWAWASTGCMEINYYMQFGSSLRFSIQYLNSLLEDGNLMGTGYACCGGSITKFVDFYENYTTSAIPWNNTNASWQDGNTNCYTQTNVPTSTITTSPYYTINGIDAVYGWNYGGSGDGWFPYTGSQTDKINAIKSVLNTNKAIYFSFHLPSQTDWNVFFDFWDGIGGEDESTLFDFDYSNTHTQGYGAGGHAVLLVGYDDTDPNPSKHHWICLNSWGTADGLRPNGLFRLRMSMNYSIFYVSGDGGKYYSLGLNYLNMNFASNQPPIADAGDTYLGFEGTPITFNGSDSMDVHGDTLKYRWDFENDGVWDTPWSPNPIISHIWYDDCIGTVRLGVSDNVYTSVDTATFTVHNADPIIEILTPNGGEYLSHTKPICWSLSDKGIYDSFVLDILYSFDDRHTWIPIATAIPTTQGVHTFNWNTSLFIDSMTAYIRVIVTDDNSGQDIDESNNSFIVDNTPPVTTKIINGLTHGENDLYVSFPNSFTFSVTDALSGVNNIYYRIEHHDEWMPTPGTGVGNKNNYEIFTQALTCNLEGIYHIEFYAEDNAGNEETIHSQTHIILDWWNQYHHEQQNTGFTHSTIPNYPHIQWKHTFDQKILSSPAVLYDQHLYIGSMDGSLYCITADTGSKVWEFETEGSIRSSPSVYKNRVYIGSTDYNVYCLDATTGQKLWTYPTNYHIYSSPTVFSDRAFIGSNDGNIYCLNATTGQKQWNVTTGSFVFSSPAVEDNYMYIGSGDHHLYCLNISTGQIVWRYCTDGVIFSSPSINENKVFVGSSDGYLYCNNVSTGLLLWRFETFGAVISSPAVCDSYVYVCSAGGQVSCLHKDSGALQWKTFIGPCSFSSPAITSGKLVVGTADGFLYCLDTTDGDIIWHAVLGAAVYSSPAVFNGSVYVGCDNKNLYCFSSVNEVPILIENVQAHPTIATNEDLVVLSAQIYGHDITNVMVNITTPLGDSTNLSMQHPLDGDYQLVNNYAIVGNYSYIIWASDANGHLVSSVPRTFTIINYMNAPPVAVSDNYIAGSNLIFQVDYPGILRNDYDSDDGPQTLSCQITTNVHHGVIGLHSDGSFTYYPNNGFTGEDYFIYKAFDGINWSNPCRVTINVITGGGIQSGDINGDGIVNSGDVRYLAKYIVGEPLYAPLFASGDINSDGKMNSADIRYLSLYLVGNPSYTPLYPE